MKFWKILVAILFTLLLLVFTRKTTAVRSVHEVVEQQGILIDHFTVPKQMGDEVPQISARVEGASDVRLFYKIGKNGEFQSVKMSPKPGEENIFIATIPHHSKGTKAWYFLEATTQREDGEVKVTLPERRSAQVRPIRLKFEGEVPAHIIIPHVLSIFGAIFFATLTLFSAIDLRKGRGILRKSVKFCAVTLLLLFIGFFPFGWAMNYFAFGVLWEAFPFGRDVTDNKGQIMLLFWLFTLFVVKGTLWGKGEGKNLVSPRGYSTLVIVSFIVTMIILAIPHSL
ncbi:MAG: hypothetical protein KAW02_03645 [candidate division Zixibacteria bacterium]|nr:hypothetical protein [candidate division Zixibacteria bacterium]